MTEPGRAGSQARRRLEEVRRRQHRQRLRMRALIGGLVVAVAVVASVLILALRPGSSPAAGTAGARAATRSAATGAAVDGVRCSTSEQTAYHIHAHLAIFVNGRPQPVPAGIGIPKPQIVQNGFVAGGKCLYWLHTHDATGVIHIESPVQRVYTLGTFFGIWGRTLSAGQVGAAKGTVTAFANGKRFTGDPRAIRLEPHAVIQLDVGTVVPPRPFTFTGGL
jgi:hypothetical protein